VVGGFTGFYRVPGESYQIKGGNSALYTSRMHTVHTRAFLALLWGVFKATHGSVYHSLLLAIYSTGLWCLCIKASADVCRDVKSCGCC